MQLYLFYLSLIYYLSIFVNHISLLLPEINLGTIQSKEQIPLINTKGEVGHTWLEYETSTYINKTVVWHVNVQLQINLCLRNHFLYLYSYLTDEICVSPNIIVPTKWYNI